MEGLADSPSIFTVGSVGNTAATCTATNYSTCLVSDGVDPSGNQVGSARGGVTVTSGGYTYANALSAVDLLAYRCFYYAFDAVGGSAAGFTPTSQLNCGTSFAQPQVAGAALLVKDWALEDHGTFINAPGALHTMLLGMGDRMDGNSATAKRSARFSNLTGAGRFQSRLLRNEAHPGGPWGWELRRITFTQSGTIVNLPVRGPGAEPSDLRQFKAIIHWAEDDATDIGDIDLWVTKNNCGGGSDFGSDQSLDNKAMVRVGPEAAGEELCVALYSYHIPAHRSRTVTLFTYYSADTAFR